MEVGTGRVGGADLDGNAAVIGDVSKQPWRSKKKKVLGLQRPLSPAQVTRKGVGALLICKGRARARQVWKGTPVIQRRQENC